MFDQAPLVPLQKVMQRPKKCKPRDCVPIATYSHTNSVKVFCFFSVKTDLNPSGFSCVLEPIVETYARFS